MNPISSARARASEFQMRLNSFLSEATGTTVLVQGLHRAGGGMSREAWRFRAQLGKDTEPFTYVALRLSSARLLSSRLDQEFRLLRQLQSTTVPVPKVVWFDDGRSLERPTIIMRASRGTTRVADAGFRDPSALAAEFLLHLVSLHSLPVDCVAEFVARDATPDQAATHQATRWIQILGAAGGERYPAAAEISRWLLDSAPSAQRLSIVHGDYRCGNLLMENGRVTSILDWELAHIGDPIEDVVWAYRPFRRDGPTNLTLRAWLRAYEEATATKIDAHRVAYYRILAELKSAAIYMTGIKSFEQEEDVELSTAVPAQLAPYCLGQALAWIDQWERGEHRE